MADLRSSWLDSLAMNRPQEHWNRRVARSGLVRPASYNFPSSETIARRSSDITGHSHCMSSLARRV